MIFDPSVAFREISKGDDVVFSCLNNIYLWYHTLDDLVDHDQPLLLSRVVISHLAFIDTIANNPFFQKNKAALLPVLQAAALAYLDSERFRQNESPLYRIGSQVLKSQYQDVFYTVATLVGGIEHAIAMQIKYRDFSFDPTPKP